MQMAIQLLCTAFVFFVFTHPCTAQKITLVPKDYIYHNMGTGSTTGDRAYFFLVEGESTPRKAGYFGQHLKKYVQADSAAASYIDSYAARQTFKLATSVSTVALVSVFAISNLADKSVSPDPEKETIGKNRGLLFVAGGTFVANLILRMVHPKSIHKAAESYNQNMDKKGIGFSGLNFNVETFPGARTVCVGVKFSL